MKKVKLARSVQILDKTSANFAVNYVGLAIVNTKVYMRVYNDVYTITHACRTNIFAPVYHTLKNKLMRSPRKRNEQ